MGYFDRFKKAAGNDGKTPEEQSKAEMEALVERFGAVIDERIKPLRESVEKVQTDWETIKAEATKTLPEDKTPRNADGTPRELTDEEKNRNASQAGIALAVQTNARLTEREVIDELPRDWSHLIPEIRSLFANTPIQRKAQPDYQEYCRNCADLVIAREARKAGLRYDQEHKTFFLEDKSAASNNEESPLSDPALVWHQQKGDGSVKRWSPEDQLRVLGIDPKEFAERAKKDGVV